MSDDHPRLPAQKLVPDPSNPTLEQLADLITDAEAAKLMRCSPRTLLRYEKRRDGLGYTMLGGKKYRRLSGIREFLARLEVKPNPTKKARATRFRRTKKSASEAQPEV